MGETGHMRELATDVLVIGAGAAGCFAALKAAESVGEVMIVSKCPISRGGATEVAESFLQAAFGHEDPRDNAAVHYDDTVRGGYLLADRPLARVLAEDACSRVADLERFGLGFTRNENGRIKQWLAAGYSYPRACSPDHGGHGIMNTLRKEVRRNPSIATLEDVQVVKCLKTATGAACGVLAVDRASGEILMIRSKSVVIATGGNGAAWEHSDVPPDETGDGMAMAYQAGCDLVDMEMVLYYPTVAVAPKAIHGTELPGEMILRRAGAKLVNGLGQEFLPAEIPVRDKLSRLIFREIAEGRGSPNGGVFLDCTRSPHSQSELRDILLGSLRAKYLYLRNKGVDIVEQPIEVAPMVHFTIGGIRIDSSGRTSVAGLFASGEVAANCHGANRLAGNALTDAMVFGARAGYSAASYALATPLPTVCPDEVSAGIREIELPFANSRGNPQIAELKQSIRQLMTSALGPIRTAQGITAAQARIREMRREATRIGIHPCRRWNLEWFDYLDVLSMLDIAETVAGSALLRTESRGHHWRLDYPEQNDRDWLKHTCVKKGPDGPLFGVVPVEGIGNASREGE